MTEDEAREIIRHEAYTNVRKHIEAIEVAIRVLGDDATMADIWRWADGSGRYDADGEEH